MRENAEVKNDRLKKFNEKGWGEDLLSFKENRQIKTVTCKELITFVTCDITGRILGL